MTLNFYPNIDVVYKWIEKEKVIYFVKLTDPVLHVEDTEDCGCQKIGADKKLEYDTKNRRLELTLNLTVYGTSQRIDEQLKKLFAQGYIGFGGSQFLDVCPTNTDKTVEKYETLKEFLAKQKPGFFGKLKKIFE